MKEKYKRLLKENISNCNVKLLSYCIMSNHAHMLMYVEDLNEMSNELVFEEKKDDISEFFKIHLNDKIIDIEDIVEYVDYREIILKYENDIGATIEKIIEDKEMLYVYVLELRNKANLSIRQISSILKINRPKITQIIKNEARQI